MQELKPCPFCGSDDIGAATDIAKAEHYCWEYWFAYCAACGARGTMADTKKEALRYWNEREEDEV